MLASFIVFLADQSVQTTIIGRYSHTTSYGQVLDEKNGCLTLIFSDDRPACWAGMTAKSLDVVLHTFKHFGTHLIEFRNNRCSEFNSCHTLYIIVAAKINIISETTKKKAEIFRFKD